MNRFFALSLLLAPVVACSSAPSEASRSAKSADTAYCWTDSDCNAGQTCSPDGVCITALAQLGEDCGGNMTTAKSCAEGLVCTPRPGQHLPVAEVGGTCQSAPASNVAQLGEACGGNMTTAKSCASGLVCSPRPGVSQPFGDVGGTCVSPVSDVGGPCGGIAPATATCQEWLQCTPSQSGGAGTCATIPCRDDWSCPGASFCMQSVCTEG